MDNVRLGRKLGIGTRVAAKMLRDRTQMAPTKLPPGGMKNNREVESQDASAGREQQQRPTGTRVAARNLTRGAVSGGRNFWKPFARIVHALWHEVTGVFFALFALFFIQSAWRLRGSWRSGAGHGHFALYVVLGVVFVYFSVTAFLTSRRHKH